MKRIIFQKLLHWKSSSTRNPLILKGVRQCGKTYILTKFGNEHFAKTHYFNFEKSGDLDSIFESNLDPYRIISALSLYLRTPINIETDLIIFDEIQACPKAITSLKYFSEDMSELHLCAAGSLLGIHLNASSYPVGKVDTLTMHPMSFEEFLIGIEEHQLAELINNANLRSDIPTIAHQRLWKKLKHYFIVGGLPEVITLYHDQQENLFTAFTQVREKQNNLITDYYADMAKYSGKVNAMHLDRLWRSVPAQLSQNQNNTAPKFKFKSIIPNINRYSQLVNVIDWLEAAELIIKIHIVEKPRIPLSAHTKENTFKLFMFDIGILGAMSGLHPSTILDYDYGTYKGYFAENFVAQEFTNSSAQQLFCWKENTAEIEFIREIEGEILPIEVKSGYNTQAKSLKVYADKYQPEFRTIMSGKELFLDHKNKIHFYPLYLAGKFPLG